jgi:hypothetical protein
MRQVYQCWWRICREINAFFPPSSNITCFYVLYPFVTYLMTLPRMSQQDHSNDVTYLLSCTEQWAL